MPPKMPKRGVGGKKGKGDKNAKKERAKAKAAARAKKQLKKLKKFSRVMYEDEFIWTKPRGELEVIAWTLQRQVEADRAERIAMRYERDWFFEMTQIYLQKIRNIRRKMDVQFHDSNDLELDIEEAKLFTRLSRKQAMYASMMRTSQLELKYRKRYRKLKKIIEILIRHNQLEDKRLTELVESLPALREERRKLKAESLDPLSQRLDEIFDESEAYTEMLQKLVNDLITQRKVLLNSELLQDMDAWSHAGQVALSRHEREFTIVRNLYVDQAHNSLNLIMLILNHWDDIDDDNKWRLSHRKIYDIAADFLGKTYNGKVEAYAHAKAKAVQRGRLLQRLTTSYKTVRVTEYYLQEQTQRMRATQLEFDLTVEMQKWINYEIDKLWQELICSDAIMDYKISDLEEVFKQLDISFEALEDECID